MRIVIAGAGAVGTHLSKLLSNERHDITLIDAEAANLEHLTSNFDLRTIVGNPASIETLKEAEIQRADLFISVTPDEASNMTICMLASKLGAKRTVARVDNFEYTMPENASFFKSVGIDSLVYPEMLAGEEIASNIQRSWVRQWLPIQGEALLLIGVKVRKGARILNKPLMEIATADSPFHIVIIKRHGDTIIPHGHDALRAQDLVYFMTTPKYVSYIQELAGKEDYPDTKHVVFLGGGSITLRALDKLPDYIHAKIFETNQKRIEELVAANHHKHVMYINGDGRDLDLLMDEGLKNAEAFVATSANSEINILSCLAAKRAGVKKTVAMVENSDYAVMAENLDIGTIFNKKTFAASHIYQMMLQADVTTVKSLLVANVDVAEFMVKENSKMTKLPVKDLALPQTITLGGMVRDGKGYLINGNTQIQAGDTIVAFCIGNSLNKLERFFK